MCQLQGNQLVRVILGFSRMYFVNGAQMPPSQVIGAHHSESNLIMRKKKQATAADEFT